MDMGANVTIVKKGRALRAITLDTGRVFLVYDYR
jgi:hypothetical protein